MTSTKNWSALKCFTHFFLFGSGQEKVSFEQNVNSEKMKKSWLDSQHSFKHKTQ